MKTPRLLAAAAAAVALLLSGCGTGDTAAVVDGHHISESGVLETTAQVNAISSQPLEARAVVSQLIVTPTVLEVLGERGIVVSDAAALAAIEGVKDPNPYFVEMARLQVALSKMTQEDYDEIVARIADVDVSVNPRFGTFDPAAVTVQQSIPDWIASAT